MNVAFNVRSDDRFGLLKPRLDAHTLGISSFQSVLNECGIKCAVAGAEIGQALDHPERSECAASICRWLKEEHITVVGFSYRLNPHDGATLAGVLIKQLKTHRMFAANGGAIRGLVFAGLPETCALIQKLNPEVCAVFPGDETIPETLERLGILNAPRELSESAAYDEMRMSFGRDLVRKHEYAGLRPGTRGGYSTFGTRKDNLVDRLAYSRERGLLPIIRAHVGPYLSDRKEAVRLFLDWTKQLAEHGFLDVLSIGSSQLTQSEFGRDWTGLPNGGGVPLASKEEFAAVWEAARPMLVRTYSGTRDVLSLAAMYEETINIAWQALSLWWFCRIDGRGPSTVRENLYEHCRALSYIASTGKPFEPNVPHHFSFRGADDVSAVVAAVVAAKVAKLRGVRTLIQQVMLNTPKLTWGVQDLAKARAILLLTRELEDENFKVLLQPRGGLDHFAVDQQKAKAQLAAVTALMDDIEPRDTSSPGLIHVVSYTEASELANPSVIEESIKITRHALTEYRRLRETGAVPDMSNDPEVSLRTVKLVEDARCVIRAMESTVPDTYSAKGLYEMLSGGFFALPYLSECREEFKKSISWSTKPVRGSICVVDQNGEAISAARRMEAVVDSYKIGLESRPGNALTEG